MGISQRSHVHAAYAFHALMAIGCALRRISDVSISGEGIGVALGENFSTFGIAFVRKFSGMVKFAPQYEQAMRDAPASGSFGAPHAAQLKDCVIVFVLQSGDYK